MWGKKQIWAIETGKPLTIMQPHVEEMEDIFPRYEFAKVRHFLTIFDMNTFPAGGARHDGFVQEEMEKLREQFQALAGRITKG